MVDEDYCYSLLSNNRYSPKEESFPGGSDSEVSAWNVEDQSSIPGSGRSLKWQPTPVFLPGEAHGRRSLAGYSPWGHRIIHDRVTFTHSQRRPDCYIKTYTAKQIKITLLISFPES